MDSKATRSDMAPPASVNVRQPHLRAYVPGLVRCMELYGDMITHLDKDHIGHWHDTLCTIVLDIMGEACKLTDSVRSSAYVAVRQRLLRHLTQDECRSCRKAFVQRLNDVAAVKDPNRRRVMILCGDYFFGP